MCTVMTVTRDFLGRAFWNRLYADAANNADGYALLLVDALGAVTILRTLDFKTVTSVLADSPWDRMFLHCRMATQGGAVLDNTHGWGNKGTFWMHNGILCDADVINHDVDSQLIGKWLDRGMDVALEELSREPYANVLMADTTLNYYAMSRSRMGTLFTDWRGNYSTNKLGAVRCPVPQFTQQTHYLAEPAVTQPATGG